MQTIDIHRCLKHHDLFSENTTTTTDIDMILTPLKSLILLVSFLEGLDLVTPLARIFVCSVRTSANQDVP